MRQQHKPRFEPPDLNAQAGKNQQHNREPLTVEAFDYHLPQELIAQEPAEPRDSARMMYVNRSQRTWRHLTVRDLPALLQPGDILVINDTRVIPARVIATRPTGGLTELLLLHPADERSWWAMVRPARRLRRGAVLQVLPDGPPLEITRLSAGRALVQFPDTTSPQEVMERYGCPPLPPYIRRRYPDDERLPRDRDRYQTVFAREPGSVAAPTAGLHFTPSLMDEIRARGVQIVPVTLHVGPGTFRPVKVSRITEHRMESEQYTIRSETAAVLNQALQSGRRLVCVGTTTVRALESSVSETGKIVPGSRSTNLFIYPPYRFRVTGALLTNFHLPRSTLLMLVCAFAGRELVLECYREAVRQRYRFYSYGDCMFLE